MLVSDMKMDKESAYLLQLIDTNCNDCKHLGRILGKEAIAASPNVFYGNCLKKGVRVVFMPTTNMVENGEFGENCFEHRKG